MDLEALQVDRANNGITIMFVSIRFKIIQKNINEVDSDLAQYKSISLHAARCSFNESAFEIVP